jgi:hypothetical protein
MIVDGWFKTFPVYFAPDAYLRNLRERWTDRWINRRPWKILMTRVQEEWRDYVTLSTILRESVV